MHRSTYFFSSQWTNFVYVANFLHRLLRFIKVWQTLAVFCYVVYLPQVSLKHYLNFVFTLTWPEFHSESGHMHPVPSKFHFYSATKHAVRALAESLRLELARSLPGCRVSVSRASVVTCLEFLMSADVGTYCRLSTETVATKYSHIKRPMGTRNVSDTLSWVKR